MTRWYPLADSDDAFLTSARFRFVHTVNVPACPRRVWEMFSADDAVMAWTRLITSVDWTSPRPFGVGTTRTVTLGRGTAALRERFYRWDARRRMTFSATAASRPGLRRFSEDIVFEPVPGGTRLQWTFACESAPWLTPILVVCRPALCWLTRGWAQGVLRQIPAPGATDAK